MAKRRRKKRYTSAGAQPGTLLISEPSATVPIQIMRYHPGNVEEFTHADVTTVRNLIDPQQVTWIDIQGLGDEPTLRAIAEAFQIHPLTLEDIVNVPQPPKVEGFEEHVLILTRLVRPSADGTIQHDQVSILLGPRYVLTFQEQPGDAFENVRKRIRRGGPIFRSSGSEYLAYALIDTTIDAFFPLLDTLNTEVEQLERTVLAGGDGNSLPRIHGIQRELLNLRREIWPLREVLSVLLRGESRFITDRIRVHLRDCYEHCVQLLEMIDTNREMLRGLLDTHLTAVANRQNEAMKTLTVMATIFIPLTFMAGIYGMNFEHMPELHTRWGYPILLVVMGVIAGALAAYFYHLGWIGNRHRNDT